MIYKSYIVKLKMGALEICLSVDESERTTWATHIKHLLFLFGFGFVWITNEVGDCVLLM